MHENKIQISAICAGFTTPHLVLLFLQTNIKHFSLCHKKMHLETKPESDMMTTICVDFKATDDAFYLVVKKWFQSQSFLVKKNILRFQKIWQWYPYETTEKISGSRPFGGRRAAFSRRRLQCCQLLLLFSRMLPTNF